MSAHAVVVAGDDEFLRARGIHQALTDFAAHAGPVTAIHLDAATAGAADLVQALGPDLFGAPPAVVVTDAHKASPALLAEMTTWATRGDDSALLVLDVATGGNAKAPTTTIAALRKAGAAIMDAKAPKGPARVAFAQQELRRAGLTPRAGADQALADGEPDLRGIVARANQLALDLPSSAGKQPTVDAHAVTAVTTSAAQVSGFTVADHLAARDPRGLSAALAAATATGTAPVLVVTACLAALREIAAVQSGSVRSLPPWKVTKARSNARKWPPADLARAIAGVGGAHPALGTNGRRPADLSAALLAAAMPAPH